MKTIKRVSIILSVAIMSLMSSCSSDDNGDGGSTPSTGNFVKAKIGGSGFSASGEFAPGAVSNGSLALQGAKSDGTAIIIQLATFGDTRLAVGTYNVGPTADSDSYVGTLTTTSFSNNTVLTYNSAICDSANGTIEITTSNTEKIEGKFSFKGVEVRDNEDCSGGTKNVTEGTFRIMLQ